MNKTEFTTLNIEIPNKSTISYPIFIGEKTLEKAGEYIKKYTSSNKLLLVSNDTVFPIYGEKVVENLKASGFQIQTAILPDGEDYKNIECFKTILDKAIDFKLERKDSIVALGGGVIGDMTGFAAASYLRGINLIQIPTTLLSQVDSSIGGKVGINHAKGKNLIGAFYQPKCVLIDVLTLNTLDNRNLKNGLGEVLKYAFIEKSCNLKTELLDFYQFLDLNKEQIYNLEPKIIIKMIAYCCKLKAAVVEQDEKESGLRAILNLGHTTGHALELCGNYTQISHGEGVAIGIIAAFRLSKELNLIDEDVMLTAENLIKKYELPHLIPNNFNIEDIIDGMKRDKKVIDSKVRFILPVKEIGKADIFDKIDTCTISKILNSLY